MRDTSSMVSTTRPRWRVPADEPHGVTAVLLRATLTRPGTTSNGRLRTWRPSTTYRSRRSRTGRRAALGRDARSARAPDREPGRGHSRCRSGRGAGRLDGESGGMHGRRASRPAGQATSSSRARARLTSPRSSTSSTEQPVHSPIPRKQQVAAELPGETLSFTYLNGAAILDAVGEETLQAAGDDAAGG